MSISALSTHSAIWNSAASALTNTQQPTSASKAKPNQADNPVATPQRSGSFGSTNLLDALSSTSQSALIQLQAQMQNGKSA